MLEGSFEESRALSLVLAGRLARKLVNSRAQRRLPLIFSILLIQIPSFSSLKLILYFPLIGDCI